MNLLNSKDLQQLTNTKWQFVKKKKKKLTQTLVTPKMKDLLFKVLKE